MFRPVRVWRSLRTGALVAAALGAWLIGELGEAKISDTRGKQMRNAALAVLLLCLPAAATITQVQSNAYWICSGTTCSSPSFTPTGGNLLVVWTFWESSSGTFTATVSDTITPQPNTFFSAVGPTFQSAAGTPTTAQIFYAKSIHGGSPDMVTVTFTGSVTAAGVVVVEYMGADINNPLDSVSAGYSTSSNPTGLLDSGNVNPANSNLLVFGAGIADITTGLSAGTNFTSIKAAYGASGSAITEQNSTAITGNNVLQRATASGSMGNWLMQMAVFRDASWTVAGAWSPARTSQNLYADQFPGSDIGAKVNSALATLPAQTGALVHLPCGTSAFSTQMVINQPIILQGCGASIGSQTDVGPGTWLQWTGGSTVAIDVGILAGAVGQTTRGVVLRDFSLENDGSGAVGIRVNAQEPKLINVIISPVTATASPFSAAGIVVADQPGNWKVNDFLCRDCYVRGQSDGIQLESVTEGTIDHSRILQNYNRNIVIGCASDTGCYNNSTGAISNNIQIINGTNFSAASSSGQIQAGNGVVLIRAENIVDIENDYCEDDGDGTTTATGVVWTAPNLIFSGTFPFAVSNLVVGDTISGNATDYPSDTGPYTITASTGTSITATCASSCATYPNSGRITLTIVGQLCVDGSKLGSTGIQELNLKNDYLSSVTGLPSYTVSINASGSPLAQVTVSGNTFYGLVTAGVHAGGSPGWAQLVDENNLLGTGGSTTTPEVVDSTSKVVSLYGTTSTFNNIALAGHLNQSVTKTIGGTCAMTSGTTCSFTLTAAFTSGNPPLCFPAIDQASSPPATAISAKCAISGTTVTVTAGASNSLTWDALLIGNPN